VAGDHLFELGGGQQVVVFRLTMLEQQITHGTSHQEYFVPSSPQDVQAFPHRLGYGLLGDRVLIIFIYCCCTGGVQTGPLMPSFSCKRYPQAQKATKSRPVLHQGWQQQLAVELLPLLSSKMSPIVADRAADL